MNPAIDLDDIPWEDGPGLPNLAPTTTRRRQARNRGPNPENVRRGRNNRKRGAEAERELKRWLEAHGALVIDQGGVGRRDKVFEVRGVRYSVEVKSLQHEARPFECAAAFAQAKRQCLPGSEPIAFVRYAVQGRKAAWKVVLADSVLDRDAWWVMQDTMLPLGGNA